MWPQTERWRAPVGDFPPTWAIAWGDDLFGLWADFSVREVRQRMRWIEPTTEAGFWMGSEKAERNAIRDKDKELERRVREGANRTEARTRAWVGAGFWLGDTPCTQALWLAVLKGSNPSRFKDRPDAKERPVENVNFQYDLPIFLTELSAQLRVQAGLPTETEWEWACRAGSTTAYWWGDHADTARANMAGVLHETTPVKRYPPNPWGLHDMHGNVLEWCSDFWRPDLTKPLVEPLQPDSLRLVRGGSWSLAAGRARSSSRRARQENYRGGSLGFRLVLRTSGITVPDR